MAQGDFDPNQEPLLYKGNTGGEFYIYPDSDNQWGDDQQPDIETHEIKIDQGNMSYTNTDFMFLYNGEWVTIISVVARLEKLEDFCEKLLDGLSNGVDVCTITKLRDILEPENDNTEDEWEIETAGTPIPVSEYVLDDKLFEIEV